MISAHPSFAVFVTMIFIAGACGLQAQGIASGNVADRARASDRALPGIPSEVATGAAVSAPPPATKFPGDDEYGEQVVLAQRANFEPWSFATDAEYYFTDNVALASVGALQDYYLRTGAQAHYTNRIVGNWFMNAAFDGHTLLHDEFDVLDFLLIKADASAMYRVPWLSDTFLNVGYTGYWLSEADLTTEAFQNHAATLGAQKIWKPARAMQIIAGASAEYSFAADPLPPQRHEYSAYLGYKLKINDRLSLSASYRAALYDYPVYDRQDWNHVIVVGASYDLTAWARLSLSGSSAWNRSSFDFFSYDNLVSGVSLSLHLEF